MLLTDLCQQMVVYLAYRTQEEVHLGAIVKEMKFNSGWPCNLSLLHLTTSL